MTHPSTDASERFDETFWSKMFTIVLSIKIKTSRYLD
jgi:hypothetical protein